MRYSEGSAFGSRPLEDVLSTGIGALDRDYETATFRPAGARSHHRYEPILPPGMRTDASTATPVSTSPMPAIHATSPG